MCGEEKIEDMILMRRFQWDVNHHYWGVRTGEVGGVEKEAAVARTFHYDCSSQSRLFGTSNNAKGEKSLAVKGIPAVCMWNAKCLVWNPKAEQTHCWRPHDGIKYSSSSNRACKSQLQYILQVIESLLTFDILRIDLSRHDALEKFTI